MDLNRKPILAGAVVVILFSGVQTCRMVKNPAPSQLVQEYSSLASQRLEAALEHLQPGTDVAVMIFDAEMESSHNAPLREMLKTIKSHLNLRHVERLSFDPSAGWKNTLPGFPYDEVLRVAEEQSNVELIVSLCGAPYPGSQQNPPAPDELPPLVIARPATPSGLIDRQLEQGRIAMAALLPSYDGDQQGVQVVFGEGYRSPLP
jgi:hypothetical protein